jgi:hypothetical protein
MDALYGLGYALVELVNGCFYGIIGSSSIISFLFRFLVHCILLPCRFGLSE